MAVRSDRRVRIGVVLLLSLGWPQNVRSEDAPAHEVTRDTVLDPGQNYGQLVIKASNITVDGRGAWLMGAREGDPAGFTGTAILAEGVSNVTLINVNARGWETGLVVRDGRDWRIEGCDFSDNFHDPKFGWGENGRRGGMVLERVSRTVVRKNRANRVWDACVLVDSHDNRLEGNDFSHTSNTGLRLWQSTRNVVEDNNLSYGLRIDPGEVHARDSTCVLIESGSNDNRFARNDCSHGGDGIFVRVLNGWVSTGNVFEENDCSYANNNCVEAWSPRNVYLRNKANHGSYGFWLGASDQTVLVGNEASWNGLPDGHHNSPHLPDRGHAGIVFMFGPSSHTVLRSNTCVGNHGAGIAAIGDLASEGRKWKAYHWIVEQNQLIDNRWGVYLQHADWIRLSANRFQGNTAADVQDAGNVTRLIQPPPKAGVDQPPAAALAGPSRATVGRPVRWDASDSRDPAGLPLAFRWDLGDGTHGETSAVEHVFDKPGFCRLGLSIDNGYLSDLAWRDVYVVEDLAEIGTEQGADDWSWIDPSSRCTFQTDRNSRLCGDQSLHVRVEPYGGGRVTLVHRVGEVGLSLEGRSQLVFWLRTRNENVPAWQGENPLVALVDAKGQQLELTPVGDFLSDPPYNEAREGWTYFVVPLTGNENWKRAGAEIRDVREVRFGFDSWGAPPLDIWLDGVAIR